MPIGSWDEIRTAWHVARAGTVSGAAENLGVHHATVIRHIDALEARLGVKLFQRHARGYTVTEAGQSLAQIGRVTEEQFAQLGTRLSGAGEGISGDLVITTLPALAPMLRPVIRLLIDRYPDLAIRVQSERRVVRLEYGEAHIAIRAGSRPTEPDNVVQELMRGQVGLYASQAYIDKYGRPTTDAEVSAHRFVMEEVEDARAPYTQWLDTLDTKPFVVLRSNEIEVRYGAIADGLAMGFYHHTDPEGKLIEVMPPRREWEVPIWMVTHVDLHRTPKVQAAVMAIKEAYGK